MTLIIEPLDKRLHDRNTFNCGIEALNVFLQAHANQNQRDNLSKVFIATDEQYNVKDHPNLLNKRDCR